MLLQLLLSSLNKTLMFTQEELLLLLLAHCSPTSGAGLLIVMSSSSQGGLLQPPRALTALLKTRSWQKCSVSLSTDSKDYILFREHNTIPFAHSWVTSSWQKLTHNRITEWGFLSSLLTDTCCSYGWTYLAGFPRACFLSLYIQGVACSFARGGYSVYVELFDSLHVLPRLQESHSSKLRS